MAADIDILTGDVPLATALFLGLVIFVGAVVQSVAGFGIGVVAGPIVALLAPQLMPEALLVAAAVLPLVTLSSEGSHADLHGLRWALLGRLPGMILGGWVVASIAATQLSFVVGVFVLLAVTVSLVTARRGFSIKRTPATLGVAGAVSGFSGTSVAVGGPPMALVYQDAGGPQIRATLAAYFAVGSVLSLITIFALGGGSVAAVAFGLASAPIVLASHFVASRWRNVAPRPIQMAVLGLAAFSAACLLIRGMSGRF